MDDDRRTAVEKALNSPFLDDFPENTLRIRRNLLVVSGLTLFYKLGGLEIGQKSTFFGIKLTGLTPGLVDIGLLILVLYFLLHFFCNSISYCHEFRLRATGAKVFLEELAENFGGFDGGLGKDNVITADPRQSTLFIWFNQHRTELVAMTRNVRQLSQDIKNETNQNFDTIDSRLKDIEKEAWSMDMATVALERFGYSFGRFLWLQKTRWLLLEWGLSIAVGAAASCVLSHNLLCDMV